MTVYYVLIISTLMWFLLMLVIGVKPDMVGRDRMPE